jgi:endogenous inhibitor of DNA gyrase (YacG/DUF329 family)
MTVQTAYAVNCPKCSGFVNVINPRVDEQPNKVWPTNLNLKFSGKIEIVRTRCPHCGADVCAKFEYAIARERLL